MSEDASDRSKRVAVVGVTGLVGAQLVVEAADAPDVRIVGISRREIALPPGAHMDLLIADPSGWDDAIAAANADVLVCALGTTWKKSGKNEAAFRAVDQDLVMACARAAKASGIGHFILVSSAGADMASRVLYSRVKGEVEDALAKLHFRRFDILRPGLLRGRREGDSRPAERLAIWLSPLLDLLLFGSRRKYRSIRIETVARAILALARQKVGGRFVHEHDAMLYAIRRSEG